MSRWTLFKSRSFMAYLLGVWLSAIGDGVFYLALSWMVVQTTGSGLRLASILVAGAAPRLVLMLLGGVAVDRLDARKLMVASDLLRAAMLAALIALGGSGVPPLWALYLFSVLFGAVDAIYWPAAGVIKQRAVAPEYYTQANGLLIGAQKAAGLLGPLVAALLLQWGSYRLNMAADALSFVISAATLMLVRLRTPEGEQADPVKRSIWRDLTTGMRFVWQTPILLTLLAVIFVANAGANSIVVAMPFLTKQFGLGADGLAHMWMGWGAGAIVGAVVFTLVVIQQPKPRLGMLAFCLQGVAILFITFASNQWQVAGLMLLVGATSITIEVLLGSLLQTIIPLDLMGRVSSFLSVVAMGSTPLAQGAAGWLIDWMGAHHFFLWAGLVEALAAGVSLFLPVIRRYGRAPALPAA